MRTYQDAYIAKVEAIVKTAIDKARTEFGGASYDDVHGSVECVQAVAHRAGTGQPQRDPLDGPDVTRELMELGTFDAAAYADQQPSNRGGVVVGIGVIDRNLTTIAHLNLVFNDEKQRVSVETPATSELVAEALKPSEVTSPYFSTFAGGSFEIDNTLSAITRYIEAEVQGRVEREARDNPEAGSVDPYAAPAPGPMGPSEPFPITHQEQLAANMKRWAAERDAGTPGVI